MRDFEGRTAVITGSASGMGLAFAERFADVGMNVVMADIEEAALGTAAARVESRGVSVLPVVTDVGNAESMDHLAEATRESFGAAHVVCLNAGVSAANVPIEQLLPREVSSSELVALEGAIHQREIERDRPLPTLPVGERIGADVESFGGLLLAESGRASRIEALELLVLRRNREQRRVLKVISSTGAAGKSGLHSVHVGNHWNA